jgi:hypothetical protein
MPRLLCCDGPLNGQYMDPYDLLATSEYKVEPWPNGELVLVHMGSKGEVHEFDTGELDVQVTFEFPKPRTPFVDMLRAAVLDAEVR